MTINGFSFSPPPNRPAAAGPLAAAALDALRIAATTQPADGIVVEERSVWLPPSWLIQRCWEELADAGFADEAMVIANLASQRTPLAPLQTILRLSQLLPTQPALRTPLQRALQSLIECFPPNTIQPTAQSETKTDAPIYSAEGLLAAAMVATRLGNTTLALVFLERIDQLKKGWEQIVTHPEQRKSLAEIIAQQPLHPLINMLLGSALRRFGDAGATFLYEITQQLARRQTTKATGQQILGQDKKAQKLLLRCIDAFRFGMLATPQSQRYAIAAYGCAGLVNEALQQSDTLTNILEARRQSALDRQSDQHLVRQVKRPAANADADFQIYALTEAIRNLDVHQLSREQRVTLANRLALTARRSDGWTAASAAQTLVELGALKFATETIERIAPNDPTRVEAVISLVRALLDVNESQAAGEQVEKALLWAEQSSQGRLRKQALIRGLGELYLSKNQPDVTWQLLERAQPPVTLRSRVQAWFGEQWNDDRLLNEALRLRALLHPEGARLSTEPHKVAQLVTKLLDWGKQLLDGEALVNFLLDALLRPLLEAGLVSQVWGLLPELEPALRATTGDKHANRVHRICTLLAEQALPLSFHADAVGIEERLAQFLQRLWNADARRNVWQVVHSIEGGLPLLIALEGAGAVVAIAQQAPLIITNHENEVIDDGLHE